MARRGKRLFDSYKRRGEWAELLFMTVASGRGFNIAKPWGESPRYDVAIEQDGRFLRVQVKSTEMWLGTCYLCQLYSFGRRAYNPKEIDFYAIYVLPADVWYIFPVKALAGMRTIALTPHLKGHKYEPYMEAWPLLTRPLSPRSSSTPSNNKPPRSISRLTQRILKRLEDLDQ
jgi:PD-(D/E)XK endonuclease